MQTLLYASLKYPKEIVFWLSILCSAGLGLRCTFDVIQAHNNSEESLWQTLIKMKKRIFKVILAICASSIVSWVNGFY